MANPSKRQLEPGPRAAGSANPPLPAPRRKLRLFLSAVAAAGAIVVGYLIWQGQTPSAQLAHQHDPGEHGGIIVPVGQEHYHVEALLAEGGVLKLFTLANDQTQVMTVPTQTVMAYVRTPENSAAVPIELKAVPQPGDPAGQTSQFEGQIPLELVGSKLMFVVPSITMGQKRYRFGFAMQDSHESLMPRKVTDAAERELYLTPGGKYTEADIRANGSQPASQRYRGFHSEHDMHPKRGDTVCPITGTKSNPKCTWVVGGKQYAFCCPPCIDEFVKLAKQQPDKVLEPGKYVEP